MANGAYISMSASIAAWNQLENTSNNLANVNTPGYKQLRTAFSSFLVGTNDGRPSEKGFTAMTLTQVDGTAGPLVVTNNPLDVAIDGPGMFMVRGTDGTRLTRAGSFRMTTDGTLVTAAGLPVLAGDAASGTFPIQLKPQGGPARIGPEGDVTQDGTTIARLSVVEADPKTLTPLGDGSYRAPLDRLQPIDRPRLLGGHIESSNVNPIKGMIELIELTKDYARADKIQSKYRDLDRDTTGLAR